MKKQIIGAVAVIILSAPISLTSTAHAVKTNVSHYSLLSDTTPNKMYHDNNRSDSSMKKKNKSSKMKNKTMGDSTNRYNNTDSSK